MTRRLAITALVLLAAAGVARAHGVQPPFFFLTPQGAGAETAAEKATVSWLDDDTDPNVKIDVYVSPSAIPPMPAGTPPSSLAGTKVTATSIDFKDPANAFTFDVSGLAPGCYQPYASLHDVDSDYLSVAAGKVVVARGAQHPVSVGFVNGLNDAVHAAGYFDVHLEVVEADHPSRVKLSYGLAPPSFSSNLIVADLAVPKGGGAVDYRWDVHGVPKGTYVLKAEAVSDDGTGCAAFWVRTLDVPGGPYADADGGFGDGGEVVLPQSAKPPPFPDDAPVPAVGCACASAGGAPAFALLVGALGLSLRRGTRG